MSTPKPRYFTTPNAFRGWLERHHASKDELLVGYYKFGSGRPSMTWSESVDQDLCFGWIDGVRRRIDDQRYCIRFTPRRSGSKWSGVNLKKSREFEAQGLMAPAEQADRGVPRRVRSRSIPSWPPAYRDRGPEEAALVTAPSGYLRLRG